MRTSFRYAAYPLRAVKQVNPASYHHNVHPAPALAFLTPTFRNVASVPASWASVRPATACQTCDEGLECTGTCQVAILFGLPLGAACERFGQCAPGLRCQRFAEQASATCQLLPALNESCASDVRACESGTFCGPDDRCGPSGGIGAACRSGAACQRQLFCNMEAENPSCAPRRVPGEACVGEELDFGQSNCAEGSLCHCVDRECTSSSCVIRRDPGELCGEPNVVCIPGTECRDGLCVISGSQGLADGCPAQ